MIQDKLGNLRRFPLERSAAADALRHLADLIEQGAVESAVGVFVEAGSWDEFVYCPKEASVTRLAGSMVLMERRVLEELADEE